MSDRGNWTLLQWREACETAENEARRLDARERVAEACARAEEKRWADLLRKHGLTVRAMLEAPEVLDRHIIGLQETIEQLLDERDAMRAKVAEAQREPKRPAWVDAWKTQGCSCGARAGEPCVGNPIGGHSRTCRPCAGCWSLCCTPTEPVCSGCKQPAPPAGDMWAELKAEVAKLKREEATPPPAATVAFSFDQDLRETVRGIVWEEVERATEAGLRKIARAVQMSTGADPVKFIAMVKERPL